MAPDGVGTAFFAMLPPPLWSVRFPSAPEVVSTGITPFLGRRMFGTGSPSLIAFANLISTLPHHTSRIGNCKLHVVTFSFDCDHCIDGSTWCRSLFANSFGFQQQGEQDCDDDDDDDDDDGECCCLRGRRTQVSEAGSQSIGIESFIPCGATAGIPKKNPTVESQLRVV